MATRYSRVKWGSGHPRVRTSSDNWNAPAAWNRRLFYQCLDCGRRFAPPARKEGYVTCPGCGKDGGKHTDDEGRAARVKQVRRRVFCASLADVFDNEVDPAWRRDLFDLIRRCPNIDFLLLTKRVGNVRSLLWPIVDDPLAPQDLREWIGRWFGGTPPANIWLGATVVNQEEADRDIPKLLAVPARVRFLSCEPLLGPIDLTLDGLVCAPCPRCIDQSPDPETNAVECRACCCTGKGDEWAIDWVIVGGESGPGARPFHVEWAESLLKQCADANVACFLKQLGSKPMATTKADGVTLKEDATFPLLLEHRKGEDPSEWDDELRVQQFPEAA